MTRAIVAAGIIAWFLAACKKDDSSEAAPPFSCTITIASPAEGSTINGGSTFGVSGAINANQEMHGYRIILYNQNDQSVVYENQYHEHAESFTVNETVTHTLTTSAPLRLVIEAAGDHEGETETKEVLFGYAP